MLFRSRPEVSCGVERSNGVALSEAAPAISTWICACFPSGVPTNKARIEELIAEAVEAARNDFGVQATNEWANGYAFPSSFAGRSIGLLEHGATAAEVSVERPSESHERGISQPGQPRVGTDG